MVPPELTDALPDDDTLAIFWTFMPAGLKTLVIVNGPIASGKNAVSTALAGILEREGHRAAVIDLDDLWVMLDHQFPRTHDLGAWLEARRAAALLTDEFYRSGRDTVVVNGPFFTAAERDAYLAHVTTPIAPSSSRSASP